MRSLKRPNSGGPIELAEDEGWCWYLSTLSGQPNIPRFRARDGRMWPY